MTQLVAVVLTFLALLSAVATGTILLLHFRDYLRQQRVLRAYFLRQYPNQE